MYHWDIVEALFKENPFVKQHIDSYNEFINKKVHRIISDTKDLEIQTEQKASIKFHKLRIEQPMVIEADGSKRKIVPLEARLRNRTYSASLYLEMSLIENGQEIDKDEVYIGEIPVMLKSDLCYLKGLSRDELIGKGEDPDEPGGYFIIKGSEKVLVSMEDIAPNRMIVSRDKRAVKPRVYATVFSVNGGFRAKVELERKNQGQFYISFPASPKNLNLFIVLKALGFGTKPKLFDAFSKKQEVLNDLLLNLEGIEVNTTDEALDYIGKRVAAGQPEAYRKQRASFVLDNYLLPHIGINAEDRVKKGYYLTKMAERCIEVARGKRDEDDRDHYANKRIKISGKLMEDLLRYSFQNFVKDLKYQIERAYTRGRKLQIRTLIRPDALTERIRFAMGTGQWPGNKQGVSQLLDRVTYMASMSHLRRVISPLSKTQQHFEARDLHPTHLGKICPHETPEGQSVGLVKNLAIGCLVSSREAEDLEPALEKLGVVIIGEKVSEVKGAGVYLNGKLIGFHKKPLDFVQDVREKRRSGVLPFDITVAYYDDLEEIYVNADEGRALRPLIIVEKGKSKLSSDHTTMLKDNKLQFSDLIKNGVIEYIDSEEEENAYIAMQEKELTNAHTHLEIHPSLMLGIVASVSPYPEHNSAPRIPMTTTMIKQAIGVYTTNFSLRTDTQGSILFYPQIPLVKTKYTDVVGLDRKAAGQNLVVAVMPYRGYNISDALVLNKAAVERGLGRIVYYRSYSDEERRYPGGQKDKFETPKAEMPGYRGEEAYKYLDSEGIVEPEFELIGGEVLLGKTSPPRFLEEVGELGVLEEKRRENSMDIKHGESGKVDWVILTEGSQTEAAGGNRLIKIRTREIMSPEVGDKLAARHGQKGIISLLVNNEDMPFSEDGIIPDLIMNPHAIPSRMTAGYMLELIGAKTSALKGEFTDATPFDNVPEAELRKTLEDYGFKSTGKEVLYDGVTGEKIEAEIFTGVVYYQRYMPEQGDLYRS
jgi:DNA-directed RNA polymerase subunit B